ncbi:hypothetical protein [Parvibaculum sp.]|uniref:hypothetical protein n=1 Tax=Parvibaculum sp. TaxID=2024848 RepID=UPI001E09C30C|nr:hypothetical protein [Parvibaculum sp.]MBX3488941.1 hypothetical protein [Parvibaculum sp.]
MSELSQEAYEIRFSQAVRAVKDLAPNRIVPLQWALWAEVQKWPVAPSIEQLRNEAQLIVNSDRALWSGQANAGRSSSKKSPTPLEIENAAQEASLRRRMPHLRKSTMDTMTRVRFIHYIGKDAYNELPD